LEKLLRCKKKVIIKKTIFLLAAALSINAFAQDSQPLTDRQYQIYNVDNQPPFGLAFIPKLNKFHSENAEVAENIKVEYLSSKMSKTKSLIPILDSVYRWQWDTLTSTWGMKKYWRHINISYDAKNNMTSYIFQYWNDTVWKNCWQYTYTYDANNNQTSELFQTWEDSVWVNSDQATFTFDVDNNQTSELYQFWKNSIWVNSGQSAYTYDTKNNQTSYFHLVWNDSVWVNSGQSVYTYDANNNQTSSLILTWKDSAWVNSSQNTYTYDSNNNRTSIIIQNWNDSAWVNSSQNTYTYDGNNNLTSSLSIAWNGGEWVNSRQTTYTYDFNNNKTSYVVLYWMDSIWVNDQQIIYTYDSNNNRTSILMQNWNSIYWVNSNQYNYSFDANNFKKSATYKSWFGSDIIFGDSTYYYFHTEIVDVKESSPFIHQKEFTIYPNPSNNGKLTLFINTQISIQKTKINIYNVLGENVYSSIVHSFNNIDIDLSNQPSGIYFIKFQTENNVVVQKIMVSK